MSSWLAGSFETQFWQGDSHLSKLVSVIIKFRIGFLS